MIENFGRGGSAIERAALACLAAPETYPGLPPIERSAIILRLFRFEALGLYSVWAVADEMKGSAVRRIIWERPRDVGPGVIEPTIFGSHAPIASSLLEARLRALAAVVLPPFVPVSGIGLDGVHFGIERGSSLRQACLYWWCDPPHEWIGVQEWFDETTAMLEAALPKHGGRR